MDLCKFLSRSLSPLLLCSVSRVVRLKQLSYTFPPKSKIDDFSLKTYVIDAFPEMKRSFFHLPPPLLGEVPFRLSRQHVSPPLPPPLPIHTCQRRLCSRLFHRGKERPREEEERDAYQLSNFLIHLTLSISCLYGALSRISFFLFSLSRRYSNNLESCAII